MEYLTTNRKPSTESASTREPIFETYKKSLADQDILQNERFQKLYE